MTPGKALLLTLTATASLALWGFTRFVEEVKTQHEPPISADLERTDAIVVLTGGSERLITGIQLLQSGTGKTLFVSGVNKHLKLDHILAGQQIPPELRACCIALGYEADSTIGNAEETRNWMTTQGYASLRVVTANYHMPRSLLLFHAAMPDMRIIPNPVAPDSVKINEWWAHPHTIELLATEYGKYLIAKLRLLSQ